MSDVIEEPTPRATSEDDTAPTLLAPLREDAPDEVDSLYAGSIVGSETTSLKSSIAKYREENGRTYHSYGTTEHWGPNDDSAQDQQDLGHHVWTLALKGRYFLSPIENPEAILDIGTGTGIWVIEVAEQHPQAKVTGTDVSPIQPGWVPPNAFFEIDDYNVEWLDENKYDLIHGRELLGTSRNWVELYKKAYKALKPGGWYEQHEPGVHFLSDYAKFDKDNAVALEQWGPLIVEAGEKAGLPFDMGKQMKGWMEEAGFINVKDYRMRWPLGGWAKDEHLSKVGQWNQLRVDVGIADFCGRRFHNQMGFSPKEIEVYCAKLRNAIRDRKLYAYHWTYFTYGQKPPAS